MKWVKFNYSGFIYKLDHLSNLYYIISTTMFFGKILTSQKGYVFSAEASDV